MNIYYKLVFSISASPFFPSPTSFQILNYLLSFLSPMKIRRDLIVSLKYIHIYVCVCVCLIKRIIFGCTGSLSLCSDLLYLVVASWGHSVLRCVGFSLSWLLLLQSMGSRHMGFSRCGSWALEHQLSSYGARAW